ncbi:MAG: DoxX family protein [Chloroflexota bacterium]
MSNLNDATMQNISAKDTIDNQASGKFSIQELDFSSQGLAILRIALGVIILVSWWDNLTKEPTSLYTGEGLMGLFNWLFDPNGNGSSLTFYKALMDATVLQVPGLFAVFQMVTELLMGIGLLVGGFSRFFGLAATFFFLNLFLAYFGGHEWIWTYVLLTVSSLAITLSYAGRTWGIDRLIYQSRGKPPVDLLW